MSVSLQVTPGHCLYDEPLRVAASGIGPGQEVTLQATVTDEGGETFTSLSRYRAGSGGELDLSQCPALEGGSFTGVEPEGPLWALQPQSPFRRFLRKDVQSPIQLQLSLYQGHEPLGPLLATATQERGFIGEGVSRIPVREGKVRGSLFLPPGEGPFPGVIELQGTGGGLLEYKASLLAGKGFATLALAYYGYEDLPKQMKDFHLEYFEEAVNFMLKNPKVKGPGIGLLGHSKGGDLVLSMATFLKGITATAVVNGSLANVGADLHYKDIMLPAIGFEANRITFPQPGVADISNVLNNPLEEPNRASLIPVGRANSKFLFIVGQEDKNFKSDFYAKIACDLLTEQGKEKPQVVCYPGAGHYIEPPNFPLCKASMHRLVGLPVIWGGEMKAHAMAQVDSWHRIQAFLHEHLDTQDNIPSKL
ncbi:acyl-coenzyme A thioesterase 2, mitochondrial [Xenopus tropicalis]|nr:acyl-coenzyme A thioesterase 2, mitochondrial [Xenopus tropicalis]AAI58301.1 LOC100144968 protein [Xenopus tropicalis]|eukprot:NP_001120006.1 acyl-coenzyme A thioesterase 2, mitochondrial [Xenopus tropicalis]